MSITANIQTGIDNFQFNLKLDTQSRIDHLEAMKNYNSGYTPPTFPTATPSIDTNFKSKMKFDFNFDDPKVEGGKNVYLAGLSENPVEKLLATNVLKKKESQTPSLKYDIGSSIYTPYEQTKKYLDKEFGFNPMREDQEDFYYRNVYDNQSTAEKIWDNTTTILGRVLGGAALKFTGGLGYIVSGIWNTFTLDFDNWTSDVADNAFSRQLEEWENEMNDSSWYATYRSIDYDKKGFFSKLGDWTFWREDVADGASFLLSAAVPGMGFGALGKLGQLGKLGRWGNLLGRGLPKGNILSKGVNMLTGSDNAAGYLGYMYNTYVESATEAAGVYKESVKELKQLRSDGDPDYKDMTDEEIQNVASKKAAFTMRGNLAVLGISNGFENRLFGKASKMFTDNVNPLGQFVRLAAGKAERINSEPLLKVFGKSLINVPRNVPIRIGKKLIEGSLKEGFWEENAQLAVARMAKGKYSAKSSGEDARAIDKHIKFGGNVFDVISAFGSQLLDQTSEALSGKDSEASISIGLGALLGMAGNVLLDRSVFTSVKRENEQIDNIVNSINQSGQDYLNIASAFTYNPTTKEVEVNDAAFATFAEQYKQLNFNLELAKQLAKDPKELTAYFKDLLTGYAYTAFQTGKGYDLIESLEKNELLQEQNIPGDKANAKELKEHLTYLFDVFNEVSKIIVPNVKIDEDGKRTKFTQEQYEQYLSGSRNVLFVTASRIKIVKDKLAELERNKPDTLANSYSKDVNEKMFSLLRYENVLNTIKPPLQPGEEEPKLSKFEEYTYNFAKAKVDQLKKEIEQSVKDYNSQASPDTELYALDINDENGNKAYTLFGTIDEQLNPKFQDEIYYLAQRTEYTRSIEMDEDFYNILANNELGINFIKERFETLEQQQKELLEKALEKLQKEQGSAAASGTGTTGPAPSGPAPAGPTPAGPTPAGPTPAGTSTGPAPAPAPAGTAPAGTGTVSSVSAIQYLQDKNVVAIEDISIFTVNDFMDDFLQSLIDQTNNFEGFEETKITDLLVYIALSQYNNLRAIIDSQTSIEDKIKQIDDILTLIDLDKTVAKLETTDYVEKDEVIQYLTDINDKFKEELNKLKQDEEPSDIEAKKATIEKDDQGNFVPKKYTLNARGENPAPNISLASIKEKSFGEKLSEVKQIKLLEIRGRNSDGETVGTVWIQKEDGQSYTAEVYFNDAELVALEGKENDSVSNIIDEIEKGRLEELSAYDNSFGEEIGNLLFQGIETPTGIENTDEYKNKVKEINATYNAKYLDAVNKGEITKQQALEALEKAGRKESDVYKQLEGKETDEEETQNIETEFIKLKEIIKEEKVDGEIAATQDVFSLEESSEEELPKNSKEPRGNYIDIIVDGLRAAGVVAEVTMQNNDSKGTRYNVLNRIANNSLEKNKLKVAVATAQQWIKSGVVTKEQVDNLLPEDGSIKKLHNVGVLTDEKGNVLFFNKKGDKVSKDDSEAAPVIFGVNFPAYESKKDLMFRAGDNALTNGVFAYKFALFKFIDKYLTVSINSILGIKDNKKRTEELQKLGVSLFKDSSINYETTKRSLKNGKKILFEINSVTNGTLQRTGNVQTIASINKGLTNKVVVEIKKSTTDDPDVVIKQHPTLTVYSDVKGRPITIRGSFLKMGELTEYITQSGKIRKIPNDYLEKLVNEGINENDEIYSEFIKPLINNLLFSTYKTKDNKVFVISNTFIVEANKKGLTPTKEEIVNRTLTALKESRIAPNVSSEIVMQNVENLVVSSAIKIEEGFPIAVPATGRRLIIETINSDVVDFTSEEEETIESALSNLNKKDQKAISKIFGEYNEENLSLYKLILDHLNNKGNIKMTGEC